MEVESINSRADICEKLNFKLSARPGSLELIEIGVLEVDSEFKNMVKSGDILFRRVSSDETDQSGDSPSMKVLKHQEALDDVTARRLSLAAQQQRQLLSCQITDVGTLDKISEQEPIASKRIPNNSSTNQRSLVTGQVSRFKGLVFHNYCPATSKENQEAREQQQEKFIQIQESKKRSFPPKDQNISSLLPSNDVNRLSYPNKCSKCFRNPDKISGLCELTVTQLKTECRLRNLPRSGNKQALINTLEVFKDEILAIENACQHITSHSTYFNEHNPPSKPHLTDRSISLPNDYHDESMNEPCSALVPPLTLNVACIGGSFSHLPIASYPIVYGGTQKKQSQETVSSELQNSMMITSDVHTQTTDIVDLTRNTNISQQLAMSTSSVCYSAPTGITSQNSTVQSLNPLLIYKLPTPLDQEPAFVQTTGLEMIQIVQQELLRNIEYQSQMSSDQESEMGQGTLQRQRGILIAFLHQLIQKTSAFYSCPQLMNEQQKICQFLNNYPSFEDIGMSQDSSHQSNQLTSQSFLAYLNQQDCSVTSADTHNVLEQCGENDLLNLINEVVTEDQMMTHAQAVNGYQSTEYAANIRKENQSNILSLQRDFKIPSSPMQVDSQHSIESAKVQPFNTDDVAKGSDQKRAAWLQRVSPRLYKANAGGQNADIPFTAFNFDFPAGSIFPNAGSHTSSDGCCSINSSITDPQILSPATEKVLFETIFQHTNSSSSAENDMFCSTMNMDDSALSFNDKSREIEG